MRTRSFALIGVLLLFAPATLAEEASGEEINTDLTFLQGKLRQHWLAYTNVDCVARVTLLIIRGGAASVEEPIVAVDDEEQKWATTRTSMRCERANSVIIKHQDKRIIIDKSNNVARIQDRAVPEGRAVRYHSSGPPLVSHPAENVFGVSGTDHMLEFGPLDGHQRTSTVSLVDVEGQKLVEIVTTTLPLQHPDRAITITLLLDPARDYVVVRRERKRADTVTNSIVELSDFVKQETSCGGIWFPLKIKRSIVGADGTENVTTIEYEREGLKVGEAPAASAFEPDLTGIKVRRFDRKGNEK